MPRYIYTEDSVAPDVRKCPKHNTWIKKKEYGHAPGEPDVRLRTRYCDLCVREKELEAAYRAKEAGAAPKQQLKIMKL